MIRKTRWTVGEGNRTPDQATGARLLFRNGMVVSVADTRIYNEVKTDSSDAGVSIRDLGNGPVGRSLNKGVDQITEYSGMSALRRTTRGSRTHARTHPRNGQYSIC